PGSSDGSRRVKSPIVRTDTRRSRSTEQSLLDHAVAGSGGEHMNLGGAVSLQNAEDGLGDDLGRASGNEPEVQARGRHRLGDMPKCEGSRQAENGHAAAQPFANADAEPSRYSPGKLSGRESGASSRVPAGAPGTWNQRFPGFSRKAYHDESCGS